MACDFFTAEDKSMYDALREYVLANWPPQESINVVSSIKPISKIDLLEHGEVDPLSREISFRDDIENTAAVKYIITLDIPPALRLKTLGVCKSSLDHMVQIYGKHFVDLRLNAAESNCLISLVVRSSRFQKLGVQSATADAGGTVVVRAPIVRSRNSIRSILAGVKMTVGKVVVKKIGDYLLGNNYVIGNADIPEDDAETSRRNRRAPKRSAAGAENVKDEDGDEYNLPMQPPESNPAKRTKLEETVDTSESK